MSKTILTSPTKVAQPEHFLAVLHTLAVLNWAGLAVLGGMMAMLGLAAPGSTSDITSVALFWVLYVEAGLANMALTLALVYRNWYRRSPRTALNKLRMLVTVVCLWEVLHLVGLYEYFGGLFSPFVVIFPVLVLGPFFILPNRSAMPLALLVCLCWAVVTGLQLSHLFYPLGRMGQHMLDIQLSTDSRLLIVLATMLCCLIGGGLWRRQMDAALQGHYPLQLVDTRFDCFSREALLNRMCEEADRTSANVSDSSVAILRLTSLGQILETRGLDAIEQQLSALGLAARTITRHDLDTVAYLGDAAFGLLLPTAAQPEAHSILTRVSEALPGDLAARVEIHLAGLPYALSNQDAAAHLLERLMREPPGPVSATALAQP